MTDAKPRIKRKWQRMRGGKTLRHRASGGFFEGETWSQDLPGRSLLCACVCACVCEHLCTGRGGESLVFPAEGPETEDLGLLEDPVKRAVCLACARLEDGGGWDPRHSPGSTSQTEFGVYSKGE